MVKKRRTCLCDTKLYEFYLANPNVLAKFRRESPYHGLHGRGEYQSSYGRSQATGCGDAADTAARPGMGRPRWALAVQLRGWRSGSTRTQVQVPCSMPGGLLRQCCLNAARLHRAAWGRGPGCYRSAAAGPWPEHCRGRCGRRALPAPQPR